MRRLALPFLFVGSLGLGLAAATAEAGADVPASVRFRRDVAERRKRARAAGRELRDMTFFTEGRGIHSLPLAGKAFGTARRLPFLGIDRMLRDELGLVFDEGKPVGLHVKRHRGVKTPVIGCMVCHTGRAAGITIYGLGNKTIDPGMLGRKTLEMARISRLLPKSRAERRLENAAIRTARLAADARWTNPTAGLVPDFLALEWFYRATGTKRPAKINPWLVKVPHLWGFSEKRKAGQFVDGFGRGVGWMAMQEVSGGQTPETVRKYAHKLERFAGLLGELLPPKYPFAVDRQAAARGEQVFADTCMRCHGTYDRDEQGFPIFQPPQMVAIEEVQTDRQRLEWPGEHFTEMVKQSPIADLLGIEPERPGYLAPRLDGIWARFPYLHNGSVPSVRWLLTEPAERPRFFSVRDAGERHRFDERALGLTVPAKGSRAAARLARQAQRGSRKVYDTRRSGHGNGGHAFGVDLPEAAKRDLIEYLKTL